MGPILHRLPGSSPAHAHASTHRAHPSSFGGFDHPPRAASRGPTSNRIACEAPFGAATRWWQIEDRDAIAVIVKLTCEITPDGCVVPFSSPERVGHEVTTHKLVRASSDFVPYKPMVDVTLVGHAHAPGGAGTVAEAELRFGGAAGFARRLVVYGDREWEGQRSPNAPPASRRAAAPRAPGEPRVFSRVPLSFDRAYGGAGFDANPAGTGAAPESAPPNLEDPRSLLLQDPSAARAACFAPIPEWFPDRARLRRGIEPRTRPDREPEWPPFRADFEWAFFQSAPVEQRVPLARGDEPFELRGVVRGAARIAGRLAGVRPLLFGSRAPGGPLTEVPLRLDTIAFDADTMRVSLTWRGLVESEDEDARDVGTLVVLGGRVEGPRPPDDEIAQRAGAIAAYTPAAETTTAVDNAIVEPPRHDPRGGRARVEAHRAEGRSLAGASLAGADLSDLDLANVDLSGADLRGATLVRCKLAGADLRGARLQDADLTWADLEGAILSSADLTDAALGGARLRGASLDATCLDRVSAKGACFDEARGVRTSLRGADLASATFSRAELPGADLFGASLERAALPYVKLDDACLSGVRATRAVFEDASLRGVVARSAELLEADLRGVDATGSDWDRALLDRARLDGAKLGGSSMRRARLREANLSRADLSGVNLRRACLRGARCSMTDLRGACLERADLTGATSEGADLVGASLWASLWDAPAPRV